MKGKITRNSLLFLTIVLLITIYVYAKGPEGQGPWTYDDGSVGQAIPRGAASHYQAGLMRTVKNMIGWFIRFIAWNPTIYDGGLATPYDKLVKAMLIIIVPFYEMVVLLIGIYFIFVSLVPARRAHAKQLLTRILIGMVLASLSPMIYQILLDIEHEMVMEVFDKGFPGFDLDSLGQMAIVAIFAILVSAWNCTLGILAIIFIVLAIVMVGLRIVMVEILAVIFPVAIALYTFDYTKGIGAKLMHYTLIWIFVPVVQAVFFVIMLSSLQDLSLIVGSIMATGSFVMITISPLLMTGLLKHIGGITVAAGQHWGSPSMVGAGYLMRGSGAGALMAAGSRVGYAGAGARRGGTKPRPGVKRGGGIGGNVRRGYRAFKEGKGFGGRVGGAFKAGFSARGFFFGDTAHPAHTNVGSQKRAKAFDKGGLLGKTKAVAAEGVASVLQPVGKVMVALGYEKAYTLPKFLQKPFTSIGRALGAETGQVMGSKQIGRGIMDSLARMSRFRVAKVAGLSLAMFTPLGFTGVGVGIAATLGLQTYAKRRARRVPSTKGAPPKGGPPSKGGGAPKGAPPKGGPPSKGGAPPKGAPPTKEAEEKLKEKKAEYDDYRLDTLPIQAFGTEFGSDDAKKTRKELRDASKKARSGLERVTMGEGEHKGKDILQLTDDIDRKEPELASRVVDLEKRTGISEGRFRKWAAKGRSDIIAEAIAGKKPSKAAKREAAEMVQLADSGHREKAIQLKKRTGASAWRSRRQASRAARGDIKVFGKTVVSAEKARKKLERRVGKKEAEELIKLTSSRESLLAARDELRGQKVDGPIGRPATVGEVHDRVQKWEKTLELAEEHDRILQKQEQGIPLTSEDKKKRREIEDFQYERGVEDVNARAKAIPLQDDISSLASQVPSKGVGEEEPPPEKEKPSPPTAGRPLSKDMFPGLVGEIVDKFEERGVSSKDFDAFLKHPLDKTIRPGSKLDIVTGVYHTTLDLADLTHIGEDEDRLLNETIMKELEDREKARKPK